MTITVSAPGKVHLTSAHIVVYGKPALLCSIGLRTYVSISEKKLSGKISIENEVLHLEEKVTSEELIKEAKNAMLVWESFRKTNDIKKLKDLIQNPQNFVKIALGETLLSLKSDLKDVVITIKSDVPQGANFGGSASVAASICGSLFTYFKKDLDKEKINALVYQIERIAHGNPSGGDNTVIVYGGLLWFRKETEFLKLFQNLEFRDSPKFLIVNSGKPEESTAEMVTKVAKLFHSRPKYTETIFNQMENFKKEYLLALRKNDLAEMIRVTRQDVRFLAKLGVVSDQTKKIISDLEELGAGVSVSGGAGKKKGSGALIVLSKDYKPIKEYCTKNKLEFFDVEFQTEGIRVEK